LKRHNQRLELADLVELGLLEDLENALYQIVREFKQGRPDHLGEANWLRSGLGRLRSLHYLCLVGEGVRSGDLRWLLGHS
jgi:hypothetical protein